MRDKRWDKFQTTSDFAEFQTDVIPRLFLKSAVDKRVHQAMHSVRDLFVHSFVQFDFAEIGVSRATHVFEMALRIRYEGLNNRAWDNRPLKKLIQWFFDNGYFESTNLNFVDHIRNIRNDATHLPLEERSHFPRFFFAVNAVDHINDIYECPLLRAKRSAYKSNLDDTLKQQVTNGATLERKGTKHLLYRADVIFVNNKMPDSLVTVRFWPIYEVVNETITDPPLIFEIPESKVGNQFGQVSFVHEGETVIFRGVEPGEEADAFGSWKKRAYKKGSEIGFRMPWFDNTLYHQLHKNFHGYDEPEY
jgi:hypothetical protein